MVGEFVHRPCSSLSVLPCTGAPAIDGGDVFSGISSGGKRIVKPPPAIHRLPLGPAVIPTPAGPAVSETSPAVVIRPTSGPRPLPIGIPNGNQFVNHRFPSGPDVIAARFVNGAGIGNSVIVPDGVIRPIWLAFVSVNHRFPSGPVVIVRAQRSWSGS